MSAGMIDNATIVIIGFDAFLVVIAIILAFSRRRTSR